MNDEFMARPWPSTRRPSTWALVSSGPLWTPNVRWPKLVHAEFNAFPKKKLHGQFMDFSRELAIFASLLSARKMKPHPTETPGSRGVEVPRTHWSAQNVLKSRVAMVEINPLIGSLSHQIHRSQNPPKNPTRRAQICKTRKVGSSWSLCP